MKKLVLINPASHHAGLSDNVRFRHQPIGLASVASLSPKDWEIVIQDENLEPAKIIDDADFVGITAFTSTATRAYELADQYRAMHIPVALGGIHAWARPEEALQHVDSIIVQEAEEVWGWACQEFVLGKMRRRYYGLPAREFVIPDRSKLTGDYPVESLATARGCPENCSFCSVHDFSGRQFRRQSIGLIEQDLAAVKSKELFIVDDNFVGVTPQHSEDAKAILKMMAPYGKDLIVQASMNVCQDDQMLSALREAGCKLLFIGLETGDEEGLQLVSKRQNLKYGFDFSRVHAAGIGVIGSFIFGLDTDTPDKMRERVKFILECGVDAVQVTILTPLPSTRLFNQLWQEKRLTRLDFPKDWDRYDMTELVYLPKGFRSSEEFYSVMFEALEKIYSADSMKMLTLRAKDWTGDSSTALFAYYVNASYRDVICARSKDWAKQERE
jgi:radical SAM superfamily enzyme YgiQ (UPF0313 family)